MSLYQQAFCPVPQETVRVARAAYPKGNLYMEVRDELGTMYDDENFAHLFAHCAISTPSASSRLTRWSGLGGFVSSIMIRGETYAKRAWRSKTSQLTLARCFDSPACNPL